MCVYHFGGKTEVILSGTDPFGDRGSTVVKVLCYKSVKLLATNRKVAGSIPAGVSGFFFDIKSFRSHDGPEVESASNRNEYQEYVVGVKAAGVQG